MDFVFQPEFSRNFTPVFVTNKKIFTLHGAQTNSDFFFFLKRFKILKGKLLFLQSFKLYCMNKTSYRMQNSKNKEINIFGSKKKWSFDFCLSCSERI